MSGFVVTDPKKTENSKRNICTFFLETSKSWIEKKANTDEKMRKERFEQHCIVALDKLCENILSMAKVGSEITVKGELTYTRFVDAASIERVRAEIVINYFRIHGLKAYKGDGTSDGNSGMPWAGERDSTK